MVYTFDNTLVAGDTVDGTGDDHADVHNRIADRLNNELWVDAATGTAATDTAALQAAIAAAITASVGRRYRIRPGTYALNDTVVHDEVSGLEGLGEGGQSRLNWTLDDNTKRVLAYTSCREGLFGDFHMDFAQPALAAIAPYNDGSATETPTKSRWQNIRINGASKLLYGVYVGGTGSTNTNNDFYRFDNLVVYNATTASFYISGTQSYGNEFYNCHGLYVAPYGMHCVAGNFIWIGGGMFNHDVDFYITIDTTQTNVIAYCNSEGSDRFIVQDGSNYGLLEVRGNRYAGNAIHADGKVIKLGAGSNQSIFEGNHIGVNLPDSTSLYIEIAPSASVPDQNDVTFIGNTIWSDADRLFNSAVPQTMFGNRQRVTGGTQRPLDTYDHIASILDTDKSKCYLARGGKLEVTSTTQDIPVHMMYPPIAGERHFFKNISPSGTRAHSVLLPSGCSYVDESLSTLGTRLNSDAPGDFCDMLDISATERMVRLNNGCTFDTP